LAAPFWVRERTSAQLDAAAGTPPSELSAPTKLGLPASAFKEVSGELSEQAKCIAKALRLLSQNELVAAAEDLDFVRPKTKAARNPNRLEVSPAKNLGYGHIQNIYVALSRFNPSALEARHELED